MAVKCTRFDPPVDLNTVMQCGEAASVRIPSGKPSSWSRISSAARKNDMARSELMVKASNILKCVRKIKPSYECSEKDMCQLAMYVPRGWF